MAKDTFGDRTQDKSLLERCEQKQAVRKLYLGSVSRLPSTLSKQPQLLCSTFFCIIARRMTQSSGSLRSGVQGLTSQAVHFLQWCRLLTQLTGVSYNCQGAHTVLVMAEDVSGVFKLIHLPHASVALLQIRLQTHERTVRSVELV